MLCGLESLLNITGGEIESPLSPKRHRSVVPKLPCYSLGAADRGIGHENRILVLGGGRAGFLAAITLKQPAWSYRLLSMPSV